jgi:hypothetical protein
MATLTDKLKPDVNPQQTLSFPLSFGLKEDNEMALSFRHSWENQNVDVHGQALSTVMSALNEFKTGLMFNTQNRLRIEDNDGWRSYETHLIDFDILNNMDFDNIQINKRKLSINPKKYSGSPLIVNLRMFNVNYDVFSDIRKLGHFLIKGEGDINYVQYIDANSMNTTSGYSHITDFKVNQFCFFNFETKTEQILFGE